MEKGAGQVCDEMIISTVSGAKKIQLYLGEIEMENIKKSVYFSPSPNMLSKEYKILINARIFN